MQEEALDLIPVKQVSKVTNEQQQQKNKLVTWLSESCWLTRMNV